MRGATTILITGFGPFPGVPENVSALFAVKLAHLAARRFRGRRVVSRVLPTEWEAAPRRLIELYRRERPHLALHFGVSEGAHGFAVEMMANNLASPSPDAAGLLPLFPKLAPDGPAVLASPIPAPEIVARLTGLGLPARLSEDAGTYLCNAVLYTGLLSASRAGRTRTGFIHIPARLLEPHATGAGPRQKRTAAAPLAWDGALLGGLEIIRACLGLPPPAASGGQSSTDKSAAGKSGASHSRVKAR